jgi:hypothetical protein
MHSTQYRAVDCDTRQPLAFSGAANKTYGGVLGGATPVVYNGEFMRGWGFNSWKLNWANLTLPASGLSNQQPGPGVRNATCTQISGAGGLVGFYCIKCRDVFTDAVQLSIRDAKQLSGDPTGGAVPPLRVVISQRLYNATGGAGACCMRPQFVQPSARMLNLHRVCAGEVYCDNKPQLSDSYKTGSANGYTQCAHNRWHCTRMVVADSTLRTSRCCCRTCAQVHHSVQRVPLHQAEPLGREPHHLREPERGREHARHLLHRLAEGLGGGAGARRRRRRERAARSGKHAARRTRMSVRESMIRAPQRRAPDMP